MKYQDKRFTVRVGDNQTYRDNWEKTFGRKSSETPVDNASPAEKVSDAGGSTAAAVCVIDDA